YAVVARVDDNSLDLLMNNRTWQVSRSWFNQHATGNYTQLHRLTPQGKDAVSAESGAKDLGWMDQQLSLALNLPETHTKVWTAELMQRTREFQQKMHLHVDGIAGEDTLMQLMRETRTTPSVLIQSANISATPNAQEKHS
ncbi:MAG: peptidoglycan-binding domain-containing protein, partial [Enterobacter sp.]|nr:peptidoglycan-binding domain-containing protein [Enterobacter sp.]